jgi:hypothetical protein
MICPYCPWSMDVMAADCAPKSIERFISVRHSLMNHQRFRNHTDTGQSL